MLDLVLLYLLTTATGALCGYVAARSWSYLPARLFVVVCVSLLLVRLLGELRDAASDPELVRILAALAVGAVAWLQPSLLLLFAALFAPQWFEGRRPIVWIALPYILAALLVLVDGAFGLGLVFSGLRETPAGPRLAPVRPGATLMLALFTGAWLVHLSILSVAFVREPSTRGSIGLIGGALVLAIITGLIGAGGVLQSLPIIVALAYTVLRTRLLLPTRAGIDTAVQAMEEAVLIFDQAGKLTYANPAAGALGLDRPEQAAAACAAAAADGCARIDGRELRVRHTLLIDETGRPIGALLLGRDVSELEAERARLAETVARLSESQAERAELAQTVQQLSMPLIPALPGVLIMPLVGSFDRGRLADFTAVLLSGIERERAGLVLLDITGLPMLDPAGAEGLLQGVRAASLLGARCVLVGVRAEIAEALVSLGVRLDGLGTAATLQQALLRELRTVVSSS